MRHPRRRRTRGSGQPHAGRRLMVMFGREALDPEIREAVRDVPDFVFSAETVPMMRQNAVFAPVAPSAIERTELATDPDGGVSMTVLRPRDAVGDLPVLY